MAFSNLVQLTAEEFQRLPIIPFGIAPSQQPIGDPDINVSITLSGWVNDYTLAFIITMQPNTVSSLNIDTSNSLTIDININNGGVPMTSNTYWTINTGTGDGSGDSWTVSYAVKNSNRTNTGTWKFAKGKTGDDSIQY